MPRSLPDNSHLRVCSNGRLAYPQLQAPTQEEMEIFIVQCDTFMKRSEKFASQDEFAALMKKLSSNLYMLACQKGVLYPAELSNLMATFVLVGGTYMPHDSKLVIVDLTKRLQDLEKSHSIERMATYGVLTAFVSSMFYLPFSVAKVKNMVTVLDDKQKNLDGKLEKLDSSASKVKNSVAILEDKEKKLDDKLEKLDSSVSKVKNKVAVLKDKLDVKLEKLDCSVSKVKNTGRSGSCEAERYGREG